MRTEREEEVCFYVEIGGCSHSTYVNYPANTPYEEIDEDFEMWERGLRRKGDWYFTGEDK